jgi:hypothetical protein
MWTQSIQGIGPPNQLTITVVPASYAKPPRGPLSLSVRAVAHIDLTTVTGARLSVRKPDGTLVSWSPTWASAAALAVSGATNPGAGLPIVLTVPSTETINQKVTVAAVGGNTAADGDWYAAVLSPTTVALYQDPELTLPVIGSGAYTSGGTCTPNDSGTATYAFADPGSGLGDCDQLGLYSLAMWLQTPSGLVPCQAESLAVTSPFAPSPL